MVVKMRWSFFSLLVALVGFTSALSASGNRLLVVLEDSTKQGLYSKFWTDLKCMFTTIMVMD
jgi:oligosaccharyltransferase complex subunit beta